MSDRWYIRINANGIVTYGFSDDFVAPQAGDILIPGHGRGFGLMLHDVMGQPLWRWDGSQLVARGEDERYTLEEAKADKKEEIRQRARDTFNRRNDTMDIAFAVSQMASNGQKWQDLMADVTDWRAARKTALDAVDAATSKAQVAAIKFTVPGR